MTVLRWTIRIHKWVALLVGIQIVLWISGGVVMSVIPIERVRGEHKIAPQTPAVILTDDVMALADVTASLHMGDIRSAQLADWYGRAVWRLEPARGALVMADARTGERLSPLDAATAQAVAETDYAGAGGVEAVDSLDDPPREYGRPGPVWRVTFDDGDDTTLYVSPLTGEVRARRSATWRFYDFFWMLHIMDYGDREHFNHPLLIGAAFTAIFVALSGTVLLIIRYGRMIAGAVRRRA